MNVVSRGIKNAFRSPLRSGAIIAMLTISISLILSMLVAMSSVNAKINQVKSNAGTNVTISPAGVMGFTGGGNALTSDQLTKIKNTKHIVNTVATLSDQLGTSDTNLTPSLELGNFGARMQRFEENSISNNSSAKNSDTNSTSSNDNSTGSTRPAPIPRTTVTGTTNPNSIATNGSNLKLTSGKTIDGNSSDLVALVGATLATKNNLKAGSTFTAYIKTITVKGIYKTGNTFQDSEIIMPLTTVQTLTSQSGSVSSVIAKVDSSDNVDSTVSALKSALGSKADITSEAEQAATAISSLESISSLALAGVIASTITGAAIILLAMVMIVRERRREIGVIKAIGGTTRKVVGQFVTEALTITIVGAVFGLAIGIVVSGPMTTSLVSSSTSSQSSSSLSDKQGGSKGLGGGPGEMMRKGFGQIQNNLTQITGSLTPEIFASAVGITFLIAIVGSAVPAWFISKIRPSEVLRTE